MISAQVIKDSLAPHGGRLTTLVLVYPRFIHSEFMTHRVFSRNAASSRAIPVKKMLAYIRENPAMPVHWGKNQAGMQAAGEVDDFTKERAKLTWLEACNDALRHAEDLMNLGVHKQVANRLLEPFVHMQTVVTSTEWDNFFNLRRHEDAEPNIHVLGNVMHEAIANSQPKPLFWDEWHLPFVPDNEMGLFAISELKKFSVARCCRVSYMNIDGSNPDAIKDLKLHQDLKDDGHMSPFEHPATPLKDKNAWSGNFRGWLQYRKEIPGEEIFSK